MPFRLLLPLLVLASASPVRADPPHVSYIFPAGGQRGTTVEFRVGGHFLHEGCPFEMIGPGVSASERIERGSTVWFEGPVIPLPASQQKEDYPKDYTGSVQIAADAEPGPRYWRVSTSQGVTPRMKFEVGDLPEILEEEIDGDPVPVPVSLPVTINGRIFPREDVDLWTFEAEAGAIVGAEVSADRIGSGMDAVLEVVGPDGQVVAMNDDRFGTDPAVTFVAPAAGRYTARIRDTAFGGLQHYVYRLTLRTGPVVESVFPLGGRRGSEVALQLTGTGLQKDSQVFSIPVDAPPVVSWNPVGLASARWLVTSDRPEHLESEPVNTESEAVTLPALTVPGVLNGRIGKPGDVDFWKLSGRGGGTLMIEVFASRLGTSLDPVLSILSLEGKPLAQNDDLSGGETDSRVLWKVPADGEYLLKIEDQLTSRGGARFGYRIEVHEQSQPDYRLTLPAESLVVERGGQEVRFKVSVDRSLGYQDAIELTVEGLPAGVSVSGQTIPKGRADTQLVFKAEEQAPVTLARIRVVGQAAGTTDKDASLIRTAEFPQLFPESPVQEVALAVAMRTPFKFTMPFETKYVARGTVYSRKYVLDRGGFEGPIEIELADRQNRHLQGVTGPKIIVPPGVSEFEYPVTLPPWMEIGRTSRSCLMASAFMADETGRQHRISFSSQEQNDQIVIIVDPVRLSVETERRTVSLERGGRVVLPVTVSRGTGMSGPVRVRIRGERHMRGWSSTPVELPEDVSRGEIVLNFEADATGPFNAPLILEAVMQDERGQPVTAECPVRVRVP